MSKASKALCIILTVSSAFVLIIVRRALAQSDPCAGADQIFRADAPVSGLWHVPSNWSENRVPVSTEIICIPPDRTAWVVESICSGGTADGTRCSVFLDCPGGMCQSVTSALVARAAAIWVLGPSNKFSGLRLEQSAARELRLSGRDGLDNPVVSRLDTRVYVGSQSTVIIQNDLIIEGDGGILEGEYLGPVEPRPTIVGPGTLTIRSTTPGQYEFRCPGTGDICYPEPPVCSGCKGSVMITEPWDIEAPLVNDGSVVATHGQKGIHLRGAPKSGAGVWRAIDKDDNAGGLIIVNCPVDVPDPAVWEVGPDSLTTFKWRTKGLSTIRLEAGASFPNLTGVPTVRGGRADIRSGFYDSAGLRVVSGTLLVRVPVVSSLDLEITGGTMQIDDTFDTDGNLTMSGGTISVAAGKQAFFD